MKPVKKKKRGFTLVEVIVTLAIIGVVLIIALPLIGNLRDSNKDKKYDAYRDSFTAASKLYVDRYSENLFGNYENGCAVITYQNLLDADLIKPIDDEDITCDTDSSVVNVEKNDDKYSYLTSLQCVNTKTDEVRYEYYDEGSEDFVCEEVNANDKNSPTISATPAKNTTWMNADRLVGEYEKIDQYDTNSQVNLKFFIQDFNGLNKNQSLKWTWESGSSSETFTHDFHNKKNSSIKTLSLDVPKKKVPDGDNVDGVYYLTIEGNNKNGNYGVQDSLGNTTFVSSRFGPYYIDNKKPTMNPTITSTNSSYHSLKVTININGSDSHGIQKMYISNTGYMKGNKWQSYQSSVTWTLPGDYDGKSRTVYITLMDNAGNITNKSVSYTVYSFCTEQVQSGAWQDTSSCSAQCGDTGVKSQQILLVDKYFNNHQCGYQQRTGVSCNRRACCGSNVVEYKNTNSCSKSCGGGNYKREAYSIYNGQRCSAYDDWKGPSCNTQGCCSASNPTACPPYHSCRIGTTVIYEYGDGGGYQGTVTDGQTLYIISSNSYMHYVYVPGGGKFHAYDWRVGQGYGWVYKNCIEPLGTNCAYSQCRG